MEKYFIMHLSPQESFVVAHYYIKMHINSYSASHDNWCTVGGDGGCRVGEVLAGTTSPMPEHKGFKPTIWKTGSTTSVCIGCSNNNTAANSRLSAWGFKLQ